MATAPARTGRLKGVSLLEQEIEWNTIKLRYINGKIGLRPLALERSVNVHTLCRRARRERWNDERTRLQNLTLKTPATPTIQAAKPVSDSPAHRPAPIRFVTWIDADGKEIKEPKSLDKTAAACRLEPDL